MFITRVRTTRVVEDMLRVLGRRPGPGGRRTLSRGSWAAPPTPSAGARAEALGQAGLSAAEVGKVEEALGAAEEVAAEQAITRRA